MVVVPIGFLYSLLESQLSVVVRLLAQLLVRARIHTHTHLHICIFIYGPLLSDIQLQ